MVLEISVRNSKNNNNKNLRYKAESSDV